MALMIEMKNIRMLADAVEMTTTIKAVPVLLKLLFGLKPVKAIIT
jgi:hypothetical protein